MIDQPAAGGATAAAALARDTEGLLLRRALAFGIDLFAAAAVFFLTLFLVSMVAVFGSGLAVVRADGFGGIALLSAATAPLLYFWLSEAGGQTLGKLALGVQVVNAEGRPPGLARAGIRTLVRIPETLLGALPAGLIALFTPYRQRLGDLAAGTYVVLKKDAAALAESRQDSIVSG